MKKFSLQNNQVQMNYLFNKQIKFGGPGSGRHPEGNNNKESIHSDSQVVQDYMIKARMSGREVEYIGKKIKSNLGGLLSNIDYKTSESIVRKANEFYKGNINKVKDAVRITVILEKQKIDKAIEYAKKLPGFVKVNERKPESDTLGYKGHAIIFKTKNGMYGEVQINTPEMIYAKETESRGRKMLGNNKYNEIANRIGVKGGLGHEIYEKWREIKGEINLSRKKQIEFESIRYYKHFFNLNIMKTNYETIRDLVGEGKTVYFEWEFEEIALKYLGKDKWEAKNKGYGGPFSVKYNSRLLADALISNPRIITQEEYDNY
jgi:hypothetical protein